MNYILSVLFGAGAMVSLFCAYQQKRRSGLIACKLSADIFWVFHYLFLGGYGGMVPNFVGIFRELTFSQRGKRKWASSRIVPVFFILLNFGIGVFTFKSPINIMPITASAFVTLSLWQKNPKLTKIITIPVSLTFLIYDLMIGSVIGAINETISICSIIISFIRREKNMKKSIFSEDIKREKPEIIIERGSIEAPLAVIKTEDATEEALLRGEEFARKIKDGFIGDFEKSGVDKMVHVSTFKLIDGIIYMTYYANTATGEEKPEFQTARLAFCLENEPSKLTFIDIMAVGDTVSGETVSLVYDTIMAQADEKTLYILWTAKAGEKYYRFYRPFDLESKSLGDIGVNRFKVGDIVNDFSTSGIVSALSENGIGHKAMYSDIGIMQKFTSRIEDGEEYFYTGAYSGDLNMIVKSRDFITWEYVSSPDFPNASKWENATYVKGDKCFYFVRQHDGEKYGFLTVYDLVKKTWQTPVLIEDCQSRSDFTEYGGELYLIHAPKDREHIGMIRIDCDNIANSKAYLVADMQGSCFYPFVDHLKEGKPAMSYTVDRKHIRLAEFEM